MTQQSINRNTQSLPKSLQHELGCPKDEAYFILKETRDWKYWNTGKITTAYGVTETQHIHLHWVSETVMVVAAKHWLKPRIYTAWCLLPLFSYEHFELDTYLLVMFIERNSSSYYIRKVVLYTAHICLQCTYCCTLYSFLEQPRPLFLWLFSFHYPPTIFFLA